MSHPLCATYSHKDWTSKVKHNLWSIYLYFIYFICTFPRVPFRDGIWWSPGYLLDVVEERNTSAPTSNVTSTGQNGRTLYVPLPYLHEWPQCAWSRPDLNNWSSVQCTAADCAGLMKSEDQIILFLAVLQSLTCKRCISWYGGIVYENVHSSEVVLDPLEGRHHIGLLTDVTFYREQFTSRWLQRFGQFLEQSKPHYFRKRVNFITDTLQEFIS